MTANAPRLLTPALALLLAVAKPAHAEKNAEPPHQSEADEPGNEVPPDLPPLEVHIDKARVDLERRELVVQMSRAAGRVELKVYGESGLLLAEEEQSFAGRPARSALRVKWTPSSDEPVAKIEVYAYDKYEYFKGIAIVPWSFSIPHEEVVFENNSAEIRPSEAPKLRASLDEIRTALVKHRELGKIALFIAGHTDTKGKPEHNLDLSRRRARSIASWFRANGLTLDIAYEGFGEASLKIKTPDETDEPQNRRVDYVLSVDTPRYKDSTRVPAWKRL